MKIRLLGLAVLLAALAAAYFFIYSPWLLAQSGTAGPLALQTKIIWVCPGFVLSDLWLLVFAPQDAMSGPVEGGKSKTNAILAVLFLVGAVAGYFLNSWLVDQIRAFGYLTGG